MRTRTVEEVVEMVKHGLKAGRMAPKQNGVTVAKKRQVRNPKPYTQTLNPKLEKRRVGVQSSTGRRDLLDGYSRASLGTLDMGITL